MSSSAEKLSEEEFHIDIGEVHAQPQGTQIDVVIEPQISDQEEQEEEHAAQAVPQAQEEEAEERAVQEDEKQRAQRYV
ncbi:MAG: hypothetical protein ACLVJ6_04005 [Merdibacter sp.]